MSLRDSQSAALRARAARKEAGKSNFNADRTRYINREFLGWACYVGRVEGGNFTGRRAGVVEEEETADRWLAGERVYFAQKADESGNLRVGGGWSEDDPLWNAALERENEERLDRVNPIPFYAYEFCDKTHGWPPCPDPNCWGPPEPGLAAGLEPVDATCEHGLALDVHCCACRRSGFLFDLASCTCFDGEETDDGDTPS